MIKKIKMKNVTSYKDSQLETDRKVNLIYGINGSGKTTISNYLRNLDSDEFNQCHIEGFNKNTHKILVYNEEFIDENFYESASQKGIFTIVKENKEALINIENAESEKEKLNADNDDFNEELDNIKIKIKTNIHDTQEILWEIKKNYTGGDRIFDKAGFLGNLKGSKEKLFNHLIDIELQQQIKTIEEIKKETQNLVQNTETFPREPIELIKHNPFSEIEKNEIYHREIIGNKNSTVSDLIDTLGNQDWVNQGLTYVDKSGMNCPFCQEMTLTEKIIKNIRTYFDKTYKEAISELKKLNSSYINLKVNFMEHNFQKSFLSIEQKNHLEQLIKHFSNSLIQNLFLISKKNNFPSQKIELLSTHTNIKEINDYINKINDDINNFNYNMKNREKIINQLKDEFWHTLRMNYDKEIKNYKQKDLLLNNENKALESKIKSIGKLINDQDNIIKINQKQITNIDGVIDNINQHLLDFGIKDLCIEKHSEYKSEYIIKREFDPNNEIFKSLSEGEKIVISLLYFVELCKGKEKPEDTKNKIIVMDDPISSLSHMYVFNIAQLIQTDLLSSNITQCFIFTHSLYFFNELHKNVKNCKLFRISKHNNSVIETMRKNDIMNEYQAYWQIIKNGTDQNIVLMANAMRNIVEYFFGFIDDKENLNHVFEKDEFRGNEFSSFKRYINRESHSNAINISDYKEFDYTIFEKSFKKLFESSGYEKHYSKMMDK